MLTFGAHNFGQHSGAKVYAIAKLFEVDVATISKNADKELAARTREELARAQRTSENKVKAERRHSHKE